MGNAWRRLIRATRFGWCRVFLPGRLPGIIRKHQTEDAFGSVLDRYPPFTASEREQEDEPHLRPAIARKVGSLARHGMVIGLGAFVTDVHGTVAKTLSDAQAGRLEDAHLQIVALRGRICANDTSYDQKYSYYLHLGSPRPPINLVAEGLGCGVGVCLRKELDRLCGLSLEERAAAADAMIIACSDWNARFSEKAVYLAEFVENY